MYIHVKLYTFVSYKLSLISVILCCDGPIALCSTVVMYLDIYIGLCHPLTVPHVCGTQCRYYDDERESQTVLGNTVFLFHQWILIY